MIKSFEQKQIEKLRAQNPAMAKKEFLEPVMEAIKYKIPLTDEQLQEKEEYVRELILNFESN